MANLDVTKHGHINLFTTDVQASVDLFVNRLGGRLFSRWEAPMPGSANAFITVGPVLVELFGSVNEDGVIGQYLEAKGPRWHSIEWRVADTFAARAICIEHGVRVTEYTPDYFMTHPKDLCGLTLEVTHHHFGNVGLGDEREKGPWDIRRGSGNDPIDYDGLPEFLVASRTPDEGARRVSELTGLPIVELSYEELDVSAPAIKFSDHFVAFVDPETVSAELTTPAPGVWALILPVADVEQTANTLRERGVSQIEHVDELSVWLSPGINQGGTIAFRKSRQPNSSK